MLAKSELGFCSLIDRETLLNEIMTSVEDLVSDPSQHVRAALGTQISGLSPLLGKEELVDISPTMLTAASFSQFVQDYCSSSSDVPPNAQGRIPRRPVAHHFQAGTRQ
jgi:hypothetical protein